MHRPASLAGQLLASVTVAVALAALGAGVVGRMVGSARNLLVTSIAVTACGQAVLMAASSTAWMVVGTALVGAGIGLFWVASQTLLGRSSGRDGSERAFAHHYAAYTLGVAGGSAIVGSVAAILRHAGIGEADAIQLSYGLAPGRDAGGRWRCGAHAASATPSRAGCARAPRPRPWRCSCPTCCWSRRWP